MKNKAGKNAERVSAKTAGGALAVLAKKMGKDFEAALCEGGKIKSHYIVLLNGKVMDKNRLSKIRVSASSVIDIIPPVGGG